MNIEGLSEATIEKLISKGMVKELADLYKLQAFQDEITQMEGFGEKSYYNLIESLEKSRKVSLPKFIYSLGIPNIGLSNAKLLCREWKDDFEKIRNATEEELIDVSGIGPVIARTFVEFFQDSVNNRIVDDLLLQLSIIKEEYEEKDLKLQGMNFVITGSLEQFPNRNALKEEIEKQGGKVTGTVTSKTSFLINNDNKSGSSKNKKAKELGIPILTEAQFLQML